MSPLIVQTTRQSLGSRFPGGRCKRTSPRLPHPERYTAIGAYAHTHTRYAPSHPMQGTRYIAESPAAAHRRSSNRHAYRHPSRLKTKPTRLTGRRQIDASRSRFPRLELIEYSYSTHIRLRSPPTAQRCSEISNRVSSSVRYEGRGTRDDRDVRKYLTVRCDVRCAMCDVRDASHA